MASMNGEARRDSTVGLPRLMAPWMGWPWCWARTRVDERVGRPQADQAGMAPFSTTPASIDASAHQRNPGMFHKRVRIASRVSGEEARYLFLGGRGL